MDTPTEASVNEGRTVNRPRGRRKQPHGRVLLSCIALVPLTLALGCYSPDELCPSAGPTQCPQFFPHEMHQATCSVARTECAAWTADATSPNGFNCTGDNLTDVALTITTCFDPTTSTAAAACTALCTDPKSYPLAPQVVPGGATICQSNPTADVEVLDGQCGTATGPESRSHNRGHLHPRRRRCNKAASVTLPDGSVEQYCGAMPTHMYSISPTSVLLKGCYDPNVMSAQTFCQNKGLWPDNPVPNAVTAVEFPWVNVASITPNSPACAPTSSVGAVTFAIASGTTVGTVQAAGSVMNLTAKGGSFATTQSCDSDGEFCRTSVSSMKVVLNDVSLGGMSIKNPEIDLVSPVSVGFDQSLDADTMTLQIAADIPGFRRDFVYVSPPTGLSVATTPTTMTLSGAFPITVNGLSGNVFSGNVSMTIAGIDLHRIWLYRPVASASSPGFRVDPVLEFQPGPSVVGSGKSHPGMLRARCRRQWIPDRQQRPDQDTNSWNHVHAGPRCVCASKSTESILFGCDPDVPVLPLREPVQHVHWAR